MDCRPDEQNRLMVSPGTLRQPGAQRHHAGHIHTLLAFRKGAAQDHVINLGRVQALGAL